MWEERELRLLLRWLVGLLGLGGAEAQIVSFFAECSLKTIQALLLKPQQQQLNFFQFGDL